MADWSYIQTFESLSNGDLNGQDSWSGGTMFDVIDTDAAYGSKSVSVTSQGNIYRDVTRADADPTTVFFSMKYSDTSSTSENFGLRFFGTTGGSSQGIGTLYFSGATAGKIHWREIGGTWHAIQNFTANVWYDIKLRFDFTNDDVYVTVDGGSEQGPFTMGVTTINDIESIRIYKNGNSHTGYIDNITDVDPSGGSEEEATNSLFFAGGI